MTSRARTRADSGATDARPVRSGVSVRVRISAAVLLLVTLALAGAGAIVYVVETQRVDRDTTSEVQQELDEFTKLVRSGTDPETSEPFTSVEDMLRLFMKRNVPDDDEVLVGWVGDSAVVQSPRDAIVRDPAFEAAASRLVASGGTTRLETDRGTVYLAAQPVRLGDERGALVVACFLAEDQAELYDTMQTYAVVAGLSLLLITGVAFWQAGRLLAPLRTLRETADRIGETDLSRRIPERGNDDITALTRTVNGMLERLETAFVGQRQFLDDAGHELKTPLTVLRGHLELLDSDDPVEVAETRELLLDEVDRMARLVGDLILLAKTNRPDFLDAEAVDVAALTTSVLAKARALGERRWSLDEVAERHAVLDEQRMTQALLALAENAVKHTAADGAIALGSSDDGERLRFWVRDDGLGVRPSDRERIFERFGRSRVSPDDEGFGLGLSIVAAIARAHGGVAHVEDVPRTDGGAGSGGSRFVVEVPLDPGPGPRAVAPVATEVAAPSVVVPGTLWDDGTAERPGIGSDPGADAADRVDTQPLSRLER